MIKDLLPKQVVCNQRDVKNKPCHGGLKRYHPLAGYFNELDEQRREEVRKEFGKRTDLVLLRCETCGTIYRLPEVLKQKYG